MLARVTVRAQMQVLLQVTSWVSLPGLAWQVGLLLASKFLKMQPSKR
jgi:hypothetical protein